MLPSPFWHQVLGKINLRRTKEGRASEIGIPPCTIRIRNQELDPAERDFYESLYKNSMTQFETFCAKGTVLHNYAHIFDLLAKLRQAVDHPYLVLHNTTSKYNVQGVKPVSREEVSSPGGRDMCAICQDQIVATEVRPCSHCAPEHTAGRCSNMQALLPPYLLARLSIDGNPK